jgi:hypothetical protein
VRTLRCRNQLQKLLRIVQHLLERILFVTKRRRRDLCGHTRVFQSRIRGHETNFVYANASRTCDSFLQLHREFGRLGFPSWKGVCKFCQLALGDLGSKLNAGQSGSREQLRELLFGGTSFERNTIKQQLGPGGAEQQTALGILGNCRAQFAPGSIKLLDRTGVIVPIQARELQ